MEQLPRQQFGGERPEQEDRRGSVAQPDRLADLEEKLSPLPELGDIPRPPGGFAFDGGYGWMGHLPPGWHFEPSWGA
jgi:hypothetical protein